MSYHDSITNKYTKYQIIENTHLQMNSYNIHNILKTIEELTRIYDTARNDSLTVEYAKY